MSPFEFTYRNHAGKTERRRVIPLCAPIWGKYLPYYTEEQWLLRAYDLDRGDERVFSMEKINRE